MKRIIWKQAVRLKQHFSQAESGNPFRKREETKVGEKPFQAGRAEGAAGKPEKKKKEKDRRAILEEGVRNRKRLLIFSGILIGAAMISSLAGPGFRAEYEGDRLRAIRFSQKAPEAVFLMAEGKKGGTVVKKEISVFPGTRKAGKSKSAESGQSRQEQLRADICQALQEAGKTVSAGWRGREILLPESVNGVALHWRLKKENRLIPVLLLTAVLLVLNRAHTKKKLERKEEAERESVMRELPELLNKIVLMLHAGLVFSAAFYRAIDGEEQKSEAERTYFSRKLISLRRQMEETNRPLSGQLEDLAGETGVREMIRVAGIVTENLEKGAVLAEKLQSESEMLWHMRKKAAERACRVAETKLTFPLMILLMVLISVTIAPAMLTM